jgi:hypothetical protein
MKKKIGRNDPCPCGSGKKYKLCCLRKTQQSGIVPWPTSPEDFVIGELLRSSKEFLAFYRAERGKIVKPVHWAQDLSLPPGVDYRCTKLQTGAQVIRLRRVPAILADAMKIAHELQHLILDSEGFPCTGAKAQFETMSSALNSMVHDPLVDSRLQTYSFDLWDDYETELKETFRQLRANPTSPSDHLGRMHWIFNYVGKVLYWELTSSKADKDNNKFQLWFDARYPDVAKEALKLLALVRNIGYDTPEKQTALFEEIIRKYNLDGVVFL